MAICGYLYFWYQGKDLGFPMAVVTLGDLLASALSYLATPFLYNVNNQLALPLWVGFLFCSLGFICGLLAGVVTKYGESKGVIKEQVFTQTARIDSAFEIGNYKPVFWASLLTAFFFYGTSFSAVGISSGFMQEKYSFNNVRAGLLIVLYLVNNT